MIRAYDDSHQSAYDDGISKVSPYTKINAGTKRVVNMNVKHTIFC